MNFARVWTDEMIAELPRLVEARLQPKQIIEQLYIQFGVEVTRNALAGKMYRMGLKCVDARTTGAKAVKTRVVPALVVTKPTSQWSVSKSAIEQAADDTDSYAYLKWRCRYPMNDDMKKPVWCGNERRKNSPYCRHHHAICHAAPNQEKKTDADGTT